MHHAEKQVASEWTVPGSPKNQIIEYLNAWFVKEVREAE